MLWQLSFFPVCTHHVFLSHCREDRERLVWPLYQTLQQRQVVPWLDQHDYPYGRTSLAALRDGMLKSRHAVFLITEAMLTQPRGWGVVELAWADVIQENLRESGGVLQNVILPLFFLPQDHVPLPRSVWQTVRDRGVFHRPEDGGEVAWAADQIVAFLRREAERGVDNTAWLQQDSATRKRLNNRPGMVKRIKALHPTPGPFS